MIIDNALITKSIAYGGRYTSDTFNSHHKTLFGDNFVVSGFALTEMQEGEDGLIITLGPGVFCTKGILVQIMSDTELTVGEIPITPKLVVAFTQDNSKETPVTLDFLSPNDVTESMTIIGYYTPPLSFTENVDTGSYGEERKSFYRPSAHCSLTEIASDVSSGLKTETYLGSDIFANVVGSDYRVESREIPLASEDPNLLVFYRGCLLKEDTHYYIESPGTLLIRGGTTLVTENGVDKTFLASYTTSFIDLIYSPDFLFRQSYDFIAPLNATDPYVLNLPQKELKGFAKGLFEPLVFVTQKEIAGSTLLSADRHTPITVSASSLGRDSVSILPRDGYASNDGFVTDEIDAPSIDSFTIIGVRGLSGGSTLIREEQSPPTLPIIDGNSAHPALDYNFIETQIPYKVDSGELQVFVDGRLCPADHFYVDHLHVNNTPDLSDISGQRYVSDKNASSIEIGTKPITYSREHGEAHATDVEFGVVDTINFRPNYLTPKTRDLTYGSSTFAGLTEAIRTPGISEALFNSTGGRHFDGSSSTFEFADTTGAAFNGNYFVTYESLAGIYDAASGFNSSLFDALTMSVSMFYDVPLGVGLSLEAAHQLNYADETTSGSDDHGWFYNDGMTTRKDPTDSEGTPMTDTVSGLYTVQVDPDKYFSENNPIVTYAALDAYMQPWMDSFGFYNTEAAPRDYKRHAGVTYDDNGEILTSFSDLLSTDAVPDGLSLVETVNLVSGSAASNKIPIATANGHVYGGRVINLTRGTIGESTEGHVSNTSDVFPRNVGFDHGLYSGYVGFDSPFKRPEDFLSGEIQVHIINNPDDHYFGIFSIPGTGGFPEKIGEYAIAANNLTCIISPIPAGCPGHKHNDELTIAKYRFVHLTPHTETILTYQDLNGPNYSSSDKPDIGIEIIARTYGGDGNNTSRHALVQWTVFGKLDPLNAKNSLTDFSDEHFYKMY